MWFQIKEVLKKPLSLKKQQKRPKSLKKLWHSKQHKVVNVINKMVKSPFIPMTRQKDVPCGE